MLVLVKLGIKLDMVTLLNNTMTISPFYKNNPYLPKSNTERSYTEDQINELIKCRDDIVYFARNYFKIVHLDKGLINVVLS